MTEPSEKDWEEARLVLGEPCRNGKHDNPGEYFCSECGRDAVKEIAQALAAKGQEMARRCAEIALTGDIWEVPCALPHDGVHCRHADDEGETRSAVAATIRAEFGLEAPDVV